MRPHHQTDILDAMGHADFYPHPVSSLTRIETHISTVFLTGTYVYKIKKPVDLGFLDFTTLDRRHHFCNREVTLNRRLSHGIYLEVVPITRQGTSYRLDGPGRPVEYAVKMRQLADRDAMAERLTRSALSHDDIERLAVLLAEFYTQAAAVAQNGIMAEAPDTLSPWQENFQVLRAFVGKELDPQRFEAVESAARWFFQYRGPLFRRRIEQGKVRDCHGDLRSDHIYFTSNGIQIIDCIEFNDRFRYQDIISDLAFLAVDLDDRGYPGTARTILRRYVEQTDDVEALPLLDFYRCYRAMVRCKVSCLRMAQIAAEALAYGKLQTDAARYLAMAHGYAAAMQRPTLWVVFGMPASGKSTLATQLASIWGIAVLHSDVIRKEMFQKDADAGGPLPFEKGIYSADATAATYDRMLSMAREQLDRRKSVVLDATFADASRRAAARDLASRGRARVVFLECRASEATLSARLRERETRPSISDARIDHLAAFKQRFQPWSPTDGGRHRVVDTDTPLAASLRAILLAHALEGLAAD